jgi:DNA-directed RNA polymerase subunit omega
MARITIEDCLKSRINAFELVILAAQRTREIEAGAFISLPRNKNKNTVVSLREIAIGALDVERLKEYFVARFLPGQKSEELSVEDSVEISDTLSLPSEDETFIASLETVEDEN